MESHAIEPTHNSMSTTRDPIDAGVQGFSKETIADNDERVGVQIFLRPLAPPAALGLAGFAGSTWIMSTWIAGWWGGPDSPTVFFPFVMTWGGIAQFIAGLYGFPARDTLATVIHCLWGSFWIAVGILYAFVAFGVVPAHSIYTHFPELASWGVVLAAFTWLGAIAAVGRDLILAGVLATLAIGSTIAFASWYATNTLVGVKVAAYFWIISSILAWWRVAVFLFEEAFGARHNKWFPKFPFPLAKQRLGLVSGVGEPGIKKPSA